MLYTIATGNAFDGILLHGPFEDEQEAIEYAEKHHEDEDWNVVPVYPPDTEGTGLIPA